jgi:tetratricopeptide (TPR) repeat protein
MNWSSGWKRAGIASSASEPVPQSQHYFAFLSYSHSDEALASWLHSALERFSIPKSLAGRLTDNGVVPRRLSPIFRDRHELAAAEDLGAEISQALAASRFLIVICSPAAANSKWTNAEIAAFKRVRPDGCLIAAIADGEPFASDVPGREAEECFPPALRHRYDKRGRPTAKRAEPLAADLQDHRDGKRLGLLKIIATMLGVGLDDLVQRDQVRRQRRLAAVAAASLAGMLVTSSLAVFAMNARDDAREQKREAEGLVGFMLGDLKDRLEPLGRLDVLDSVGAQALGYYQKQDKSALSDEALTQRSKALTLMGEVANTRGDLAGALGRYEEALASTTEIVRRHPGDPQRLFDHAQNVYWVGYIAWQRGQTGTAVERFRQYKSLADRMVAIQPGNAEYRLEQIYADSNLGTVLLDNGRFAQAVEAFSRSLGPVENLAAAEPSNADYQKQLSDSLGWLADAHEKSGGIEQALAVREREFRLLEGLKAKNPRDVDLQRTAMTNRRAIGRLLASRGEVGAALPHLLQSVAMSDQLFAIEPDNTEWLQAGVASRFDLADLQLSVNRPDVAAVTIRSACDIAGRLLERDRSVADWRGTMRTRCLILRGRLSLTQNNYALALSLARQALAVAEQSQRPLERKALTLSAVSLGSGALEAAGRRNEAVRWASGSVTASSITAQLAPRELADLALTEQRAGRAEQARRIAARLDAIGYRHPQYLHSRDRIIAASTGR